MSRLPVRSFRSLMAEHVRPISRPIVGLVVTVAGALIRHDWREQQKLPGSGGVLLVANHISNADPLLLGVFVVRSGRWPQFLAKASLFRIPLLGRILTSIGQIPVQRHSTDARSALVHAERVLADGGCVLIYPEGTITDDDDLWPMAGKTGAARLALATGCPVVPVGQWGAQQIMYGKRVGVPRLLPRKLISVLVGDPIDLDDLRSVPSDAASLATATRRMMAAITDLVAELRDQPPPER
jgi:1-acyl-sn-glycerol-3-phosphate acyltransferase